MAMTSKDAKNRALVSSLRSAMRGDGVQEAEANLVVFRRGGCNASVAVLK